MKVIIAGGRDIWMEPDELQCFINDSEFSISEVVCGMAKGVDTAGRNWASTTMVPVKRFPADWNKHGKSAGPIRNRLMAVYADALILIWDGKSKGSANMLNTAKAQGLKIHEQIVGPSE